MIRIPNLKVKTTVSFEFYELLFVVYYWGFILIRPLLQAFESKSTLILFCYVILLLSIFVMKMIIEKDNRLGKSVFFILFIFLLLLFDVVVRHNSYSFQYLYKFIYSGIIPVILLSKIRDPEKVLRYFVWFSLITFLLFGSDPFRGFGLFESYMDYGFNLVMPAFIGMFLGFHLFKIRWMLIFEILCFFCVLIFANRSSLLSVVVFMFFYFVFFSPIRKRNVLLWTVPLVILVLLVYFYAESIVQYIYNITVIKFGINSYTLNMLTGYFANSNDFDLFSGRTEIWNNSRLMIKEHLILGHGMGAFQHRYSYYSHNIYLDFLLFFGVFGLIFFTILILYSLIKIYRLTGQSRILGLLFLAIWFPKLLFSTYFLEDIGFWCFLSFPFVCTYLIKEN